MTFSEEVKRELTRISVTDQCCQRAELAALIRLNGSIEISRGDQWGLSVTTQNPATARVIFKLFRAVFGVQTEIYIRRKVRLRKNNVYLVRCRGDVPALLRQVGLLESDNGLGHGVAGWVVERQCCCRAYLRGAFLAAGAINDPQKVSYHLEITTDYEEQASVLCALMEREELTPKVVPRKKSFVVYLKESEQIVRLLNIIGAHTALLQFEDARIRKYMRNQVNRLVNAETANLSKTVAAAMRQTEAIRLLAQRQQLAQLSPALRQVAELRLAHPEASLQELGQLADPPLSKSAVNHRLRKLVQLAFGKED
ncbi:MAG: DNA-binding protein WhiA [Firmicutes bacterium]|nr:DNA-binding protein WhiA [Bacillota bacterium]